MPASSFDTPPSHQRADRAHESFAALAQAVEVPVPVPSHAGQAQEFQMPKLVAHRGLRLRDRSADRANVHLAAREDRQNREASRDGEQLQQLRRFLRAGLDCRAL
jgi:hypothetical protein